VDATADTLARMEGAAGSLLFSSGMAAIVTSMLTFVKSGDHMVSLIVSSMFALVLESPSQKDGYAFIAQEMSKLISPIPCRIASLSLLQSFTFSFFPPPPSLSPYLFLFHLCPSSSSTSACLPPLPPLVFRLYLHSSSPLLFSTPPSLLIPLPQVACQPCYGGVNLFTSHILEKMGVEVTWVKGNSIEQYKQAVKANTKVKYTNL